MVGDDAEKSLMSHTVLPRSQQHLHNKKRKPNIEHRCGVGQIPSEGQVRTFFTTLECQSWGELCVPFSKGLWGFYSSIEPTSITCITSLFLMEKIFINAHIFQNPFCGRILFILGFDGLGLVLRSKFFPFRISW